MIMWNTLSHGIKTLVMIQASMQGMQMELCWNFKITLYDKCFFPEFQPSVETQMP